MGSRRAPRVSSCQGRPFVTVVVTVASRLRSAASGLPDIGTRNLPRPIDLHLHPPTSRSAVRWRNPDSSRTGGTNSLSLPLELG